MSIMQVGIVASLGMKKTPGRRARISRKDLPETVLSRRGCLHAREKRSFLGYYHMVKVIPTKRDRQDEEVGFGITSFGVVVENL